MSILDRIKGKKKSVTKDTEQPKKAAPALAPRAASKKALSVMAADTILAPLVTEKTARLADSGVYVFRVPVFANRVAVRQAFSEMYGVRPTKVNIVLVHGKENRFGQVLSRQSDWKKALVSVPAGSRVDVFEK